jgi:hypothetical protein
MSTVNLDVDTFAPWERHTLPNGSIVYYRDSDHAYSTEIHKTGGKWSYVQGSRLTSVTTAIKPLDFEPDGLMRWAVRQFAEGRGWEAVREARAESGTKVHKHALYALASGKPLPDFDALTEEERGYALGVLAFWHEHEPVTEYAEQVVYSAKYRVVGRLDLIAEIDGRRVMVDAKTSASGFIPVKHHAQGPLYDVCARECGVGPTDAQFILMVFPDGRYELIESLGTHEGALCALATYREAQRISAGMTAQRKAREAA